VKQEDKNLLGQAMIYTGNLLSAIGLGWLCFTAMNYHRPWILACVVVLALLPALQARSSYRSRSHSTKQNGLEAQSKT
jgi:hypothetical protein